jgi:hypothetical protein
VWQQFVSTLANVSGADIGIGFTVLKLQKDKS